MSEYIEKETLESYLKGLRADVCDSDFQKAIDDILNFFIREIPIAAVTPIKQAHWISIIGYDPRDSWAECSRCRTTVQFPGTKYCPNCGSAMTNGGD